MTEHNKLILLSAPLALLVSLAGLLSLFGYWVDIEQLYRPIANGPATNPLTALCFFMGGLYVLMETSKNKDHPLKAFFILVIFSAAQLKIIDYLTGSHITEELSPFYYDIMSDVDYGKSNSMGLNTGIMFFVLSLAFIAKAVNYSSLLLFFSTIALVIPIVSLLGYILGRDNLYGEMSLLTALLGVFLVLSFLASSYGSALIRSR